MPRKKQATRSTRALKHQAGEDDTSTPAMPSPEPEPEFDAGPEDGDPGTNPLAGDGLSTTSMATVRALVEDFTALRGRHQDILRDLYADFEIKSVHELRENRERLRAFHMALLEHVGDIITRRVCVNVETSPPRPANDTVPLYELPLLYDKMRLQNRTVTLHAGKKGVAAWPEGRDRTRAMTRGSIRNEWARLLKRYTIKTEDGRPPVQLVQQRYGMLEDGRFGRTVLRLHTAYVELLAEEGKDHHEVTVDDIHRICAKTGLNYRDEEDVEERDIEEISVGI